MPTPNTGPFIKYVRIDRRRIPEQVGVPDPEVMCRVFDHVSRWVGPVDQVISDRCDDTIHLDWFIAGPTPEHPFKTVVTAGMSSAPLSVPEVENGRLWWSELFVLLPPDWPLDLRSLEDETWSWPLTLTADMARMPHIADTLLWRGHLFELTGPRGPLCDGVPFYGAVLAVSDLLPRGFHSIAVRPGKEIGVHCVIPLLGPEIKFAKRRGTWELLDRMIERGVSDVIDCGRKSAVD